MTLAEHARDLFLRLSAIDGEPDEIAALIVGALEGAVAAEREHLATGLEQKAESFLAQSDPVLWSHYSISEMLRAYAANIRAEGK